MKKFYLIHGFESCPNRGFFPWLMGMLFKEAKAFALSLEMPSPATPIASQWVEKIAQELGDPNLDKYLVGHSLGVPAILRYLETLPEDSKIGGVFLVAGFINKLDESDGNSDFRKVDNFVEKPFDFEHIKKVCNKFYVIHGENDPVVPIMFAKILTEKLNIKPVIINGAEHFYSSRIFELPELLDIILKEIKDK